MITTAGFSQYLLEYYDLVARSSIDSIVIGLKDDLEANEQALNTILKKNPLHSA